MPVEKAKKKARAYYVSLIIELSVQPATTLRRFLPFDGSQLPQVWQQQ